MSLAELFFRKNPRPSFWSRLRRARNSSFVLRRSYLARLSTQHFFFEALEPRLLLSAAPTAPAVEAVVTGHLSLAPALSTQSSALSASGEASLVSEAPAFSASASVLSPQS